MPKFEFILHSLLLSFDHDNKRVIIKAVGEAQDENGNGVTAILESPELQASFEKHLLAIIKSSEFDGNVDMANLLAAKRVHQDLSLTMNDDREVQ